MNTTFEPFLPKEINMQEYVNRADYHCEYIAKKSEHLANKVGYSHHDGLKKKKAKREAQDCEV